MKTTPVAKDGQLKVQYGKHPGERQFGIVYAWGAGCPKSDMHLIHNAISSERYSVLNDSWNASLIDELISRGYDITTLKFTIEKKKDESVHS